MMKDRITALALAIEFIVLFLDYQDEEASVKVKDVRDFFVITARELRRATADEST